MNHLPHVERENSHKASRPLIDVEGAVVIALADTGTAFCTLERLDTSCATLKDGIDGTVSITVDHPMPAPLVVTTRTSSTVSIVVKRNASAHVVIIDEKDCAINVHLMPDAQCTLYLLPKALSVCSSKVSVEVLERAHLRLFEFGLMAAHCDREIDVTLSGKAAQISYFGLDQLHGAQRKSTSLVINHRAEESKSEQTFRGIYGGESLGSFLGQVIVDKDAAKSSARQLYRSTILSKNAKAHVMPQLVIYNHDITASHGASIGELNPDALFYLCSRGLSMSEAKALLVSSTISDILDHIEMPAIKQAIGLWSLQATARLLGEES